MKNDENLYETVVKATVVSISGDFVQQVVDAVINPIMCHGQNVGEWLADDLVDAHAKIGFAVNSYLDRLKELHSEDNATDGDSG
ncbi:MAG: hypothetical protein FH749_06960 [Firmicutes bacterium]|nr:hypothetical protein [Bacillota bacterium]